MCWFYRSIFHCKLLLAFNGFLSSSRFGLLTGIHWTDTQVDQSQNKSWFMTLAVVVDVILRTGSFISVKWLFMLYGYLTINQESSLCLVKTCGSSVLWLSGEALRERAQHQEVARLPLSVALSCLYNSNKISYIPWRMCTYLCAKSSLSHWSQQLWAAESEVSKLEGTSLYILRHGSALAILTFSRLQENGNHITYSDSLHMRWVVWLHYPGSCCMVAGAGITASV